MLGVNNKKSQRFVSRECSVLMRNTSEIDSLLPFSARSSSLKMALRSKSPSRQNSGHNLFMGYFRLQKHLFGEAFADAERHSSSDESTFGG